VVVVGTVELSLDAIVVVVVEDRLEPVVGALKLAQSSFASPTEPVPT
jgi:hypothetical protein